MSERSLVHVVDDDEGMRASQCALLESVGMATISYPSAENFLDAYNESMAGCVVTDLRMLGMNGVELVEELADRGSTLAAVVVTAFPSTTVVVRAMKAGAVDVLEKPFNDQEFLDAVSNALRYGFAAREQLDRRHESERRLLSLTAAEREVMELIVAGLPNKAIAVRQEVSTRTVEMRRQQLLRKMNVRSVAGLVRAAVEAERLSLK